MHPTMFSDTSFSYASAFCLWICLSSAQFSVSHTSIAMYHFQIIFITHQDLCFLNTTCVFAMLSLNFPNSALAQGTIYSKSAISIIHFEPIGKPWSLFTVLYQGTFFVSYTPSQLYIVNPLRCFGTSYLSLHKWLYFSRCTISHTKML